MMDLIKRSQESMRGAARRQTDPLLRFSVPGRPSAARAMVLIGLALLGIAG
jgi:hypothetical protein